MFHEFCALNDYVVAYSNTQSSIHPCENPVFHERTKHINVRLHFIRYIISQEVVRVVKIHIQYNPWDIGTKVLPLMKLRS